VDRYDVRSICAMFWTSLGIGLNILFLQNVGGAPEGRLVLIPIAAGVALAASGLYENIRRSGRDFVFVNRVWAGSMVYVALSAACAVTFQPRPY